jgi:hypothetical protein
MLGSFSNIESRVIRHQGASVLIAKKNDTRFWVTIRKFSLTLNRITYVASLKKEIKTFQAPISSLGILSIEQ